MKTKYGEINKIEDYFEKMGMEEVKSESGNLLLTRFYEICKCKICGDIIKGLGLSGAYRTGDRGISDLQKEHLELHYKIGKTTTLTEIEVL